MILAALAWMSLWFAVDSKFAKWTFEVTGALAILWPIVDIARGPRCRCFLRTRVSGEFLPPVSRIKTADNFLALIRPVIESVQGALTAPVIFESASELPPPDLSLPPGYLPEFVFGTFLLNALVLWATTRFPNIPELPGVLMNTLFAEVVLIIFALFRRKGRDPRMVIYVILALSLVGVGFDLVTFGGRTSSAGYMKMLDKAKNGAQNRHADERISSERRHPHHRRLLVESASRNRRHDRQLFMNGPSG